MAVIMNLALCDNTFGVGIVTYLNMVRLQCIWCGNCNVLEYGMHLTWLLQGRGEGRSAGKISE